MSERKIKLPKLKDLKKKRSEKEAKPSKSARRAGALSVPESVGEQKQMASREQVRRDTFDEPMATEAPGSEAGVISSVRLEHDDRRSRRIEVPEHVRTQYGRGGEGQSGEGSQRA